MTVENTLAERGARYGDFTVHAILAQNFVDLMRYHDGWTRLSRDKRQALTVIADKIARILSGDPEYTDNWHDIQGYARLAEQRCVKDDLSNMPLDAKPAVLQFAQTLHDATGPMADLAPDLVEAMLREVFGEFTRGKSK